MKKIFFIFPEFKDTITGGTYYDHEVCRYLKKIHVPTKKIVVSSSITQMRLSYLVKHLPKKSIILIDGYLANKISFAFNKNIHILVHHPCCLEKREGKMSNLNLYFNEKKAFSNSKSIITVSFYMKKVIQSLLDRIVKIEVAYPGIDSKYFSNKIDLNSNKILAVGNVIERKGYHILIEALSNIKHNWHLNIIGKYSKSDIYYLKLIEKIEKYKLSENITFLGNITDNAKMKYVLDSKIFVLPTSYEGFGISLVEACASGMNVITSDLPVLKEVLRGGKVTFFPTNDANKLSEAIEYNLLSESKSSDSKIRHYTWNDTAKNFKRLFYAN
jgi:glycosyltransferase involved in cell wall biosynthesis